MTYAAFWLRYLRAHDRPGTRVLHYAGTGAALVLLPAAVVLGRWWPVPLAVMLGYGLAWTGHVAVEHNRPATFGHPVWSLLSDLRMLALCAGGRLGPHLDRARAATAPGSGPAPDRL